MKTMRTNKQMVGRGYVVVRDAQGKIVRGSGRVLNGVEVQEVRYPFEKKARVR